MSGRCDKSNKKALLREKLIGLGEQSMRKSYYPELQQRLAELERFKSLLDQSNDAIFLVQLPHECFVDINESACRLLGYSRTEILQMRMYQLADISASRFFNASGLYADYSSDGDYEILTTTLRGRADTSIPVEMTIRLAHSDEGVYAVVVSRDITDRKRVEERLRILNAELEQRVMERTEQLAMTNFTLTEQIKERTRMEQELLVSYQAIEAVNQQLHKANEDLERMASTDRLTGAWNRRYFEKQADHEMVRAQRYKEYCSIIMLDIDHFKNVNDVFGHLVGDLILFELAQLLQDNLRKADCLARWGGEEFVVLAPHLRAKEAMELAEKLRSLVEVHEFPEVGRMTVSAGVAEFRPGISLNKWIKSSDDALYRAKTTGRNCVQLG